MSKELRATVATLIKAGRRDLARVLASGVNMQNVYTDPNLTPQQRAKLEPLRDSIIRQTKRHAGTLLALHIRSNVQAWDDKAVLSAEVLFPIPGIDPFTTPKDQRSKKYHALVLCTKRGSCYGYLDRFSGKHQKRKYKHADLVRLLQYWPDL